MDPEHASVAPSAVLATGLTSAPSPEPAPEPAPAASAHDTFEGLDVTLASAYERQLPHAKHQAWRALAPEVKRAEVRSSLDGARQPLLFYASRSPRAKPLLVVLHSWSADYRQSLNIPYANWAVRNDWVFVQPNFRGANTGPQATASEQAVQDVVDAVNYARAHANVDEQRIYLTGYSGGGMMALVMAARHPELWAGVVAWAPVVDLVDWYTHNRQAGEARYAREIAASCGGPPRPATSAATEECRLRSPLTQLAQASGARFPIYIGHGLQDRTVKPSHALWAFNALAAADRFSDEEVEFIATHHALPEGWAPSREDALFAGMGAPLRLERSAGNVTLALFEGGHDIIYNAGLRWLEQARRR